MAGALLSLLSTNVGRSAVSQPALATRSDGFKWRRQSLARRGARSLVQPVAST